MPQALTPIFCYNAAMRAQILPPTPDHLARAAEALLRGEVVGMPTETVYGLAGAAFQPEALARIFDTKERPTFDPLILHVGFNGKGIYELERLRLIDLSKISELARTRAQALIQAFWPGPLTLVLPKHADVPELATSGLPSVAIRMPSHRVAQALLAAVGTPLAAPSANRFGRISPTSAQAVAEELGDRIDYILDGGACEIGVESTVIRIEENGALTQLRPGGLTREQIETAAGCTLDIASSSSQPGAQAAPGMLESHYSPVKPMVMLPQALTELEPRHWASIFQSMQNSKRATGTSTQLAFLLQKGSEERSAAVALEKLKAHHPEFSALQIIVSSLSTQGDLNEAARTLFSKMRALDASPAQIIFAEPCAMDHGLGHAIADRLTRACGSKLG